MKPGCEVNTTDNGLFCLLVLILNKAAINVKEVSYLFHNTGPKYTGPGTSQSLSNRSTHVDLFEFETSCNLTSFEVSKLMIKDFQRILGK